MDKHADSHRREVRWLACGVLRAELDALFGQGRLPGRATYLDSMLHMKPCHLETCLERVQAAAADRDGPAHTWTILVYGDCCPRMDELSSRSRTVRVDAINCAQMLLGKPRYRALMHAGAFLLQPEWTARWQRVFQVELGLDASLAPELMGEHRSGLVYLDTGVLPVPLADIQACAAYTGLPWQVETCGLDQLADCLHEALARIAAAGGSGQEEAG